MTRLHLVAPVIAGLLIPAAAADPLDAEPWRPAQQDEVGRAPTVYTEAQDLYGDNESIGPGSLEPINVSKYLTFLSNVADSDKDGFVDRATVGDVNPTGYVVFHFRSRWLNQRVTLGQGGGLLDVPMRTMSGGGGPPSDQPAPLVGDWSPNPPPLDPDAPDGPEPQPPVPEPSGLLLSLPALSAALIRRPRRARPRA